MKIWIMIILIIFLITNNFIIGCIEFQSLNNNIVTVDISGRGDYIRIQDAINKTLDNNTILVKNGIYYENIIINSNIDLISNNPNTTIIDGNGIGDVIKIFNKGRVNISGFTIRNSGIDIYNSGINIKSDNCNISNNFFINNSCGVYTSYSKNINISNNYFSSNYNYGLYISTASVYNEISLNSFIKNKNGLRIKGDYNRIFGNIFINNSENGLYFCCNAKENIVFKNLFDNNSKKNAYGNHYNNKWDNGIIGNYWSDYLGEDLNTDGIGDTPYPISFNNQDNYPIIKKRLIKH